MEPRPVAVFDFDGTLSKRDCLLPFLIFLNGFWKTAFHLFLLCPKFFFFFLIGKDRQLFKETLLNKAFASYSLALLEEKSHQFADKELNHWLNKEGMDRFLWHKNQGHLCILASANLSLFLDPWARKMGFDYVIASNLEVSQKGFLSGKLKGLNCFGEEKARRVKEVLKEIKFYPLFAYGDSPGDLPLLAYADFAYYKSFTTPYPCKNLKKSPS